MKEIKLDLDKNTRRRIEQAYASAHILSEEQKRKRIQDKIERARVYSKALHGSVWWQKLVD